MSRLRPIRYYPALGPCPHGCFDPQKRNGGELSPNRMD